MRTHAMAMVGALVVAVSCGGCKTDRHGGGDPSTADKDAWWTMGTQWKAEAINGKPVKGPGVPTFQMLEGGRAGGSAGVNRWSAAVDEEAFGRGSVKIGDTITTLMAGAPEAMATEAEFLAALKRAATIDPEAVRRGELRMLDEHGVEVLRFVKP